MFYKKVMLFISLTVVAYINSYGQDENEGILSIGLSHSLSFNESKPTIQLQALII